MEVPPHQPFLLEHQQSIGVVYLYVTQPTTPDDSDASSEPNVTTTRASSKRGSDAAKPVEPRRSDEEVSFMTAWELEALGGEHSVLRCRWCLAPVSEGGPGVSAVRLPSEYWLELSDFWVCHAEVALPLLSTDVRAMPRRRLAGETHVLIHTDDVGDAVDSVPAEAAAVRTRPTHHGSGDDGDDSYDDDDDDDGGPEVVECRRCRAPLGTVVREVESTLRLHKDRLAVFSELCDDSGRRTGTIGNWLAPYSVLSRLWTELVDRASSHSQYRFILHAVDRVTGTGDDLASTAPRARLRLLNWQSSVSWRSTPGGRVVEEVPTLKVAFELYDEADTSSSSPAAMDRLRDWHSSYPAQPVILLEEECQQAMRMLRETHALLPPSARTLKDMAIGFLPAVSSVQL